MLHFCIIFRKCRQDLLFLDMCSALEGNISLTDKMENKLEAVEYSLFRKLLDDWKQNKNNSNLVIPRIYPRALSNDKVLEKFQEDVKAIFLENKCKTLMESQCVEILLARLKHKKSLNYSEYKEMARSVGPSCEALFTATLFAQLQNGRSQLSVKILKKYIEEKLWFQHSRFSLAVFTDAGKTFMTENDLDRYVQEFIPSTSDLNRLDEHFIEFYVCTIVRKFIFFLDPYRSGRIRVTDIVASGFLNDLKKLENDDLTDCREINWFSIKNSVWLYLHYLELDTNQNGMLDRDEMINFENGALTNAFLDRVFQACQTYGGEIDYKTFLDLTLALENRNEPQSILFLFRILDLNDVGYLDTFVIRYFYRSIEIRLQTSNREVVPFENVCTEVFDMVKPVDPSRITVKDLIASGKGSTAVSILIDFESFCSYESREEQIKDEVDAISGDEP